MSTGVAVSRTAFGIVGMICGGAALMLVVFHFYAGPFQPQKSLERTIAEIAVNISKEVVRVAKGKPADLERRSWSIDDILRIVVSVSGVLALILAAIGFARREDSRPVAAAAGLGASAIGFQFISWLALLAAGLVLVWIVVSNLGEILGS